MSSSAKPVNLFDQYMDAIDQHTVAVRHRDSVLKSWHATEREKSLAIQDAAAAASRCVQALRAYRQDLLSGLEIIERDDAFAGSVVPWWEQQNQSRTKQQGINGYDKISDRSDAELQKMLDDVSRGEPVVDVAKRWNVSIAALTILATHHGAFQPRHDVETQRKAKKKYKWKYTPPEKRNRPRFVRDDANIKRVVELINEGSRTRDIADRLGVSHTTILRARRIAIKRGYLPDDPPMRAQALYCADVIGLDYDAIAEAMNTVRGHVSNYVRNGRQHYKTGLAGDVLAHCERWYERVTNAE